MKKWEGKEKKEKEEFGISYYKAFKKI
jgi:hypothetical protein